MVAATMDLVPTEGSTGELVRLMEIHAKLGEAFRALAAARAVEERLRAKLDASGKQGQTEVAEQLLAVREQQDALLVEIRDGFVQMKRLVEIADVGVLEQTRQDPIGIELNVASNDPSWICFRVLDSLEKTGQPGGALWLLDQVWMQREIIGRYGTHELLAKGLEYGWRYRREYVGRGRSMGDFLKDHPNVGEATAFRYSRYVKRLVKHAVLFAKQHDILLPMAV